VMDFLREGDTLTITRIDRLARSIGDLQDIVRELRHIAARSCAIASSEMFRLVGCKDASVSAPAAALHKSS
jgi:DNA invertase Pin-like site-specific DNA recombinase